MPAEITEATLGPARMVDHDARPPKTAWRSFLRRPMIIVVAVVVLSAALPFWRHWRLRNELALARELLRQSQPQAALDHLTRLAAQWPKCGEAEFLSAVACRRAQRFDLVEPHLRRAAELAWDPREIERQRYLMFFQAGDFLRSGPELREMVLEDATDDEAEETYEAMARGYMAGLLFQEARFMLDGWTQWRPESVAAHFLNADLAVLMANQEGEIAAYREILRFAPSNFEARRRLGHALMLTHEGQEAYELLTACRLEQPHEPHVLLSLAEWHRRHGQAAAAAKYLDDLLGAKPDSRQRAAALVLFGQIALDEGEFALAAQRLREAVDADGTNIAAVYSLSQALSRAGRTDEAKLYLARWEQLQALEKKLDDCHDSIVTHPDDPDLRAAIGEVLLEKGETKSGVNWLLSALFYDPAHAHAHRLLAEHYRRVGQTELAARHQAIAEGTAAVPPGPLVLAPGSQNAAAPEKAE